VWAVPFSGIAMRTLLFLFLAFAASATAQPTKHFTDADLEVIFTYVLAMPSIKDRAPEPLPRG
jgi:hypothetical protein